MTNSKAQKGKNAVLTLDEYKNIFGSRYLQSLAELRNDYENLEKEFPETTRQIIFIVPPRNSSNVASVLCSFPLFFAQLQFPYPWQIVPWRM